MSMVEIDPATLSPHDSYRLLISCVVPRPIAWVSTLGSEGQANLAPFSFFGGVAADPPTVMLSISPRNGDSKDTAHNLLERSEAVIHIPHRALAEKMVATSAEVGRDVDEFELAGLTKVPSVKVQPPRIAEAAIAMEALLLQHQQMGNGPVDLFFLQLVHFHVDEALLNERRVPDAKKLQAVGRLGGLGYCDTGTPFDLARPA